MIDTEAQRDFFDLLVEDRCVLVADALVVHGATSQSYAAICWA